MARRKRQAAAICYRKSDAGVEFLLVRTIDDRWTFPKGQVDPGHSETEAAVIEAWEEAGACGEIENTPLTTYFYSKGAVEDRKRSEVEVAAFLFEVTRQEIPPETFRDPHWYSAEDAERALAERRGVDHAAEFARVIRAALDRLGA